MLTWNEIVQKYTVNPSDKIKKITSPLTDHLRIAEFFYVRINHLGQLVWMGNNPACSEYYVERKYFIEDPCMKHPNFWQSGYSLLGTVAPESFRNTFMAEANDLFHYGSWIMLSIKELDSVELFGFVGEKESPFEKVYLNHPNLLKTFAKFFKSEMHSIICEMEEDGISLVDLKGKDFHQEAPSIFPTMDSKTYQAFLEDCGMRSLLKKVAQLSKRERQCLKMLLLGKSAKESANELNLSYRTVEFYLENIKNKLNCNGKRELCMIGRDFENLGLL